MPTSTTEQLFRHLLHAPPPSLLVVTGAGVSAASGLPLFRGEAPDATWNANVTEIGTRRFFELDPVASWAWYLERFASIAGASPNPAHIALRDLEEIWSRAGGDFLLCTQNVDGLHRVAGSQSVVEVHGRADRMRCSRPGCSNAAPKGLIARTGSEHARFLENPRLETLPTCSSCGCVLRPHVLWFDERYDEHQSYRIASVLRAAKRARLVIFVGTSFSVGVTAMVIDRALKRATPVLSIDPSGRSPHPRVVVVDARAETVLPEIVTRLSAR